jgi:hypothetical protein
VVEVTIHRPQQIQTHLVHIITQIVQDQVLTLTLIQIIPVGPRQAQFQPHLVDLTVEIPPQVERALHPGQVEVQDK